MRRLLKLYEANWVWPCPDAYTGWLTKTYTSAYTEANWVWPCLDAYAGWLLRHTLKKIGSGLVPILTLDC